MERLTDDSNLPRVTVRPCATCNGHRTTDEPAPWGGYRLVTCPDCAGTGAAPKRHKLSFDQISVLAEIGVSALFGREVRAKLAVGRPEMGLASFYELMGGLEDRGMVAGEFVERPGKPGQRERQYRVTAVGAAVLTDLRRRVTAIGPTLRNRRPE